MNKFYTALIILFALLVGVAFITFSRPNETNNKTSNSQLIYQSISSEELKSYLDSDKDIYLLDVHIPEQTHIKGTDDFIPFNDIEKYQAKLPKDKNTEIVVYCRSGNMSETASETLIKLGYKNVKNLLGGTNAWKANGYE